LQKAESTTDVAQGQLPAAPAADAASDALQASSSTDTVPDKLQAAVENESVTPRVAGKADDTQKKSPTVADTQENAPRTPAVGTENDQVMVEDAQRMIIFFHHDSHNLPEQAGAGLNRLLEAAVRSPGARISIMGYTDSLGNEWYNRKLSQTRADMVRDFFIERGIEPEKIRAVGMGPENPLASNDTADGRRKNRRVEIYVGSAVN
jgi:outer membrane protein OmpA-like peptidoglycan-associated protein